MAKISLKNYSGIIISLMKTQIFHNMRTARQEPFMVMGEHILFSFSRIVVNSGDIF